jgi:hypothetical protein
MIKGKKEKIAKLKANIKKMEREWKKDLKKEYGGGMDSAFNMKLTSLRIALRLLDHTR